MNFILYDQLVEITIISYLIKTNYFGHLLQLGNVVKIKKFGHEEKSIDVVT